MENLDVRECWFQRKSKTGKANKIIGRATACASDPKDATLLFLNCALPVMAAKAALAMLRSSKGCDIFCDTFGFVHKPEERFKVLASRLPQFSTVQVTVVANRPDVVLGDWRSVLWQRLSASDITTPLLEEWAPYIGEILIRHQRIVMPNQFGYPVFLARFKSEDIDDIVSDGLKKRKLRI